MDDPEEQHDDSYAPHHDGASSGGSLERSHSTTANLRHTLTRTVPGECFDAEHLAEMAARTTTDYSQQDAQELSYNVLMTGAVTESEVDFRLVTDEVEIGEAPMRSGDINQGVPNRYDIIEGIGAGANGQVFSAFDNNFNREVAVKFLHPRRADDARQMERFIREARITGALSHPNILPIHDIDISSGGLPYFTMRRADGLPLAEAIAAMEEGRPAVQELDSFFRRASVMMTVCDAVAYAHDQGIVHQDIKPDNIIIGAHGNVLLIDWGTAITAEERADGTALVQGTPAYMAPEQARREMPDERSDVYCLGATLFHLLVLRLPTWSGNMKAFWDEKRAGVIQLPTDAERKRIPAPLLAIAMRALEADPADRYQRVADMRADLEHYQEGLAVSAYSDSVYETMLRMVRRHRAAVLVGLVACCLLAVAAGVYIREKRKEYSRWNVVSVETFDSGAVLDPEAWIPHYFLMWQADRDVSLDDRPQRVAIEDGRLVLDSRAGREGCLNLTAAQRSPGSLRISWTATAHNRPADLNCFIAGDNRFLGYTFHVGGYNDRRLVVCTRAMDIIDSVKLDEPLAVNRPYHFVMERDGKHVRLRIDGKMVVDIVDTAPLLGTRNLRWGFETANNLITIDNLQVERKLLPEKVPPIAVAEGLLAEGFATEARERYETILSNYRDADLLRQAEYGIARSLAAEGRHRESRGRLQTFLIGLDDPALRLQALMLLLQNQLALDDLSGAEQTMGRLVSGVDTPHSVARGALSAYIAKLVAPYRRGRVVEPGLDDLRAILDKIESWQNRFGVALVHDDIVDGLLSRLVKAGYPEEVIERFPDMGRSRLEALAYLGRDQEILDSSTTLAPERIASLARLGRHEQAIEEFGMIPETYTCYRALGRLQEIIDSPDALHSLKARALVDRGDYEAALAFDPSNLDALIALGRDDEIRALDRPSLPDNVAIDRYLLHQGEVDAIIARGKDYQPPFVQAQLIKACRALKVGDVEAAREHLAAIPPTVQVNEMIFEKEIIKPFILAVIDNNLARLVDRWRAQAGDPRFSRSTLPGQLAVLLEGQSLAYHYGSPIALDQETEELLLKGMRGEAMGDRNAAWAHYTAIVDCPPEFSDFLSWRIEALRSRR